MNEKYNGEFKIEIIIYNCFNISKYRIFFWFVEKKKSRKKSFNIIELIN